MGLHSQGKPPPALKITFYLWIITNKFRKNHLGRILIKDPLERVIQCSFMILIRYQKLGTLKGLKKLCHRKTPLTSLTWLRMGW